MLPSISAMVSKKHFSIAGSASLSTSASSDLADFLGRVESSFVTTGAA
jgi:hypothetical protein